jgi:hypothetical protein
MPGRSHKVESNIRYYSRRAAYEAAAAAKALTPEAQMRRRALADMFAAKAQSLQLS